jgi:hypothetical protein
VWAAGALRGFYSNGYIAELERCSPFRFGFLESRGERLARHKARLAKLFEAFLAGAGDDTDDEPVFPMLPNLLLL